MTAGRHVSINVLLLLKILNIIYLYYKLLIVNSIIITVLLYNLHLEANVLIFKIKIIKYNILIFFNSYLFFNEITH